MRWFTLFLLALHSGPALLCWAWSPVTHQRLARSFSSSNLPEEKKNHHPLRSSGPRTKTTGLRGANDADSAMSAYDQAMKAMTAPKVSGGDFPADAKSSTTASTATGTGVKDLISKFPIAPAFAVTTTSAPETNVGLPENAPPGIPTPEQTAVPTSTSSSRDTDANNDAGMSVYDQYMKQQAMKSNVRDTNTPAKGEPDFVESTFNDATISAQERSYLADATTWTGDAGVPPVAGSIGNQGLPYQPPTQADQAFPEYTQSPRQASPPNVLSQPYEEQTISLQNSDALFPMNEEASDLEQQEQVLPIQQEFQEPQILDPPPIFSKETTVQPQTQSLMPPVSQVEQIPRPMGEQMPIDTSAQTEESPALIGPPPPEKTATPPPIIPPPEVNMDDPIARMAAAAKSGAPPTPLDASSFMSNAWDEARGSPSLLKDPINFLTSFFVGKRESRQPSVKAPDMVKTGVSKRILEKLDTDRNNPRAWSPWDAFQNAEDRWDDLKNSQQFNYDVKLFKPFQNEAGPPLQFVSDDCAMGNAKACSKLRDVCDGAGEECQDLDYEGPPLDENGQPIMDYDVVILGGTLGIFYGLALQKKGLDVCVVAPRYLKGQDQEWNVGEEDLQELQSLGILDSADIEAATTTKYGGSRAGFKNKEVTPLTGDIYGQKDIGFECYLTDVLNRGVSPALLIDSVVKRFKAQGGVIRELCPLKGVAVSQQVGCAIDLGSYNPEEEVEPITSKIVLDCMGYGSPVARQQRYGVKPDSICMVFGSCASGYNPDRNRFADIMYTFNPLQDYGENGKHQYFWESFPVGTNLTAPVAINAPSYNMFGTTTLPDPMRDDSQIKTDVKTTYMFTYIDAEAQRPSLEALMDDYWKFLPTYQSSISDPEAQLDVKRVVYDYFPAYRDSPMKPQYSRVLSVGESAGMQSPISFGGFRSVSRNIDRISGAVAEAIETGCLHKDDLSYIHDYNPQVGAGWFLRDIMSVPIDQRTDPQFTNRVLSVYLKAMYDSGPNTINPFMQDVLKFDALVGTMVSGILAEPKLMIDLVQHVGLPKTLEFLGHVANMGLYGLLDASVSPFMEQRIEKIKDPRKKFQWRRRLEAWKYGSGNDYAARKRKQKFDTGSKYTW